MGFMMDVAGWIFGGLQDPRTTVEYSAHDGIECGSIDIRNFLKSFG